MFTLIYFDPETQRLHTEEILPATEAADITEYVGSEAWLVQNADGVRVNY